MNGAFLLFCYSYIISYQTKLHAVRDHQFLATASIPSTWSDELQHNPFLRLDARYRYGELWQNVIEKVQEIEHKSYESQNSKKGRSKSPADLKHDLSTAIRVSSGRSRQEKEKRLTAEEALEAETEMLRSLRMLKDGYKVPKLGGDNGEKDEKK
jgi:hypothetical protein